MPRPTKGRPAKGRLSKPQEGHTAPYLAGSSYTTPTLDWSNVTPEQVRLPSVAEMAEMTIEELNKVLNQLGLQQSWNEARADAQKYVSRMTSLQSGTPAFKAEVDALIDIESRRGNLGLLRSSYRQFTTLHQLEGLDPATAEFDRMCEGDDMSCDRCLELAGFEGTMAEQAAVGLPGAASCAGGMSCRCDLILVTD